MSLAATGIHGWIGGRLRVVAASRGLALDAVRARAGQPCTLPAADTFIHVGGIAHDLRGRMSPDDYHAANARLPVDLASACAGAGYRRFVFVSSAKVVGDVTADAVNEETVCAPQGAYAVAKRDAERALERLAPATGLDIRVVRPPLVYGPGVGANFERLVRLADSPLPWPERKRPVRRSLVYIDNLVDALLFVAGDAVQLRPGGFALYHVADGPAQTVDALLTQLRAALGRPHRRLPMPAPLLELALALPGLGRRIRPLFESLELDTRRLEQAGWTPPVAFGEAIRRTVVAWQAAQARPHATA
jgi:UDP-glucose 4-epimerase